MAAPKVSCAVAVFAIGRTKRLHRSALSRAIPRTRAGLASARARGRKHNRRRKSDAPSAFAHGQGFSERAERTASRIGAVLLFTLAAYIVGGAAWSLWTRHGEAFSLPGLIVALLAMPIMTLLARRKTAIATQLGSRAMRADAAESITCGWLSLVVVVGLLADLILGAWWVDAVTSLVIVGFVVKEAREAWSGEDCCNHD